MVELVNNHVLFPEPPNWKEKPRWQRRWQNTVSPAVTFAESRLGVRTAPRISLTFMVTLAEIPSLQQFDDRVRAARKSGLACTAYCGRGYVLQEDVDADTAVLDREWNPALGAYLFLQTSAGLYEVRQVAGIAAETVTLDAAVGRTYKAGTFCWPLIFGKFSCDELPARTPGHASLKLTISELVSPATAQLGAVVPPVGAGIGVMKVETTFAIA